MASPIDTRDHADPGDQVLRKFRYQHAYGVVLLVAIATGRPSLDYIAIWCEQHEDFLAETDTGLFDAFQIKTRKSELGAWELNDEALYKSIERFVKLDLKYPGKIRRFKFVSNTESSNSQSIERGSYSPLGLLEGVRTAKISDGLTGHAKTGFELLTKKVASTSENLFSVLKRLDLIVGPTERAYEHELCQSHLPNLPGCAQLSAIALAKILDVLLGKVATASSLFTNDPSRHWVALNQHKEEDPLLLAKKITSVDVTLVLDDVKSPTFQFLPELTCLQLGTASGKLDVLRKKMTKGGLALYYDSMYRRALTAEQQLLDIATRPDDGSILCSQLENVVMGECSDANLRASLNGEPFGRAMLVDVQNRLRHISENEPSRVHRHPCELLVGIAGLLTSECKVWWSEIFDLDDLS